MAEKVNNSIVVSGRQSFFNGWDPTAFEAGDPLKFNTSILWDKSDKATTKLVTDAFNAAVADGKTRLWGGKTFGDIDKVIHDGDKKRPDDPNYKGKLYITAKSNADKPPRIVKKVNGSLETITDRSEMYSGAFGHNSVTFYPHDKKGIAIWWNSTLKWKNGERLSGGSENVEATYGDGFETEENESNEEFDI